VQAPRNTYTIREGSLEEKTEEDGAAEVTAAGHPAPARTSGASPDIRRFSRGRTSGITPEIRQGQQKHPKNGHRQAGHPARARTSGLP